MVRTLKRTGGKVPFATSFAMCWWLCIVMLLVFTDAANADDSSSQTGTVTADGQKSGDDLTTMEKGMKPFFDMVKNFLGVVQPNKLTEQTWINFSNIYVDGQFKTEQFEDWKDWTNYLVGFVVCAAVGVLFFIVMPITGLIFCCCRCCGKCGGRPKAHDPKRAGCKRKSYCTVLLLLNTITLAGVVCAFLSNELVYQKLRNENNAGPVGKLTTTVDHISDFANATVQDVEMAVLDKFDQTKTTIINRIRSTANDAVDDVLNSLNATALLAQTRNLSRVVNQTQDELTNLANELTLLSTYGSMLAHNLTRIADGVEQTCQTSGKPCGNFDKSKYLVTANFSTLDDLSTQATEMNKSLPLGKYIVDAENKITETKNSTTHSVNSGINKATTSVEKVRDEIDTGTRELNKFVQEFLSNNTDKFKSDMLKAQDDITKYGKYWWYGGLGVSCALLLVVLFYYVGVLFGLCGERPGLGAQCCNTGTGANFLMAGVGFTFILAWLLMLVCLILFIIGGPIYTEVCRYFDDHKAQELQPFNDAVMEILDLQKSLYKGEDVDLDLVTILEGCENDAAIYAVLKLDYRVNLTNYLDLTKVREALSGLKSDKLDIPDIEIVTSQLNQTVIDYANAGLSGYNFTPFYREVNKNLTAGDLHDLARNLRAIGRQSNVPDTFRDSLNGYADELDQLDAVLVTPMKRAVSSLNASLGFLEKQADAKIKPATEELLNGLQTAQDQFNTAKDRLVKTQLDSVINDTLALTETIVQGLLNDVYNNIGKCRPLFDAFYSASDSVCVVVLDPLNGFWFSLGWCLFFFIPCLIFAVKLAGLYRREHDEKDFDDPNYILYGGRNQDTIPLTSVDERSRHLAYPGPGMSNSGYHRDSYTGPIDKYAPPPYGASHNGMGSADSNGSRGQRGHY